VRASNIFRKGGVTAEEILKQSSVGGFLADDDIWELWLTASKLSYVTDQCIATTEPAYLAKFAFQLAQSFNNFYHRHHILHEPDERRKEFLMLTAAVARRELLRALEVMGISVPDVM
jgi:arginyl-tRNA synthetase